MVAVMHGHTLKMAMQTTFYNIAHEQHSLYQSKTVNFTRLNVSTYPLSTHHLPFSMDKIYPQLIAKTMVQIKWILKRKITQLLLLTEVNSR